jgi:hypothetical protein
MDKPLQWLDLTYTASKPRIALLMVRAVITSQPTSYPDEYLILIFAAGLYGCEI